MTFASALPFLSAPANLIDQRSPYRKPLAPVYFPGTTTTTTTTVYFLTHLKPLRLTCHIQVVGCLISKYVPPCFAALNS